jgi:hypothetical protein
VGVGRRVPAGAARRIAMATASGNANGMDAAIQSNPGSGGFPS